MSLTLSEKCSRKFHLASATLIAAMTCLVHNSSVYDCVIHRLGHLHGMHIFNRLFEYNKYTNMQLDRAKNTGEICMIMTKVASIFCICLPRVQSSLTEIRASTLICFLDGQPLMFPFKLHMIISTM